MLKNYYVKKYVFYILLSYIMYIYFKCIHKYYITVASEIQNKLAQDRLAILNKLRQQATQSLTHEQNKIHNTLKKRRKDTPKIKTSDLVLARTKDWFPT